MASVKVKCSGFLGLFKAMTEFGGQTTTAYERKLRRREIIRLKWGSQMSNEDIAEELGCSESTILRDLRHIKDQLGKLDDPDFLKEQLRGATQQLLDHELDDLRQAEVENDEKAKHRAKSSLRSTVKVIKEVEDEIEAVSDRETADEFFDELPEDVRDGINEAARSEVEEILGE